MTTTEPNFLTIIYLIFNVLCSITIVLLNKWVYLNIGFPNLTLTLLHFVTTFLGLCLCERLNVFQVKTVHVKEMILLSCTFCGFVVLTNLSLEHNSVGSFQVAKVMTAPCVMLIQMTHYRKHFTTGIKLTLIPITLGVVLNFYYDLSFNLLGTFYATLGVGVTSLYQILVGSRQQELQMNPMQLLYCQIPLSSAMLLLMVVMLEPPYTTFTHSWSGADLLIVLCSCVTAFFVNLSIYWIIGNLSPLTYNMVGHLKLCLTVIGGLVIFQEPITLMQATGVLLTVSGVTIYAHLKLKQQSTINHKSLEEG